jgi:peptidoglycan hydrolase-like protein with peptidoglycan-binding domain
MFFKGVRVKITVMAYSLSQFKAVLDGLGYNLGPNGYGGNHGNTLDFYTQAAIQEFQLQNKLPTTGMLDQQTLEKARQLMRNLKHSLNLTTDAQLPINEFYGPRTLQAVMKFQKMHNLPVTGISGAAIRQKLDAEVKKQLQQQSNNVQQSLETFSVEADQAG